ncbi:MAG: GatB/YqeY domain-containing protein [Armatimonadota bacterium]
MTLRERLETDLKTAMKAGDSLTVSVIRLARSEIRNSEIEKGRPLTDEEILQVLTREGKKRRESISQYEKGGRPDLVEKEQAELRILSTYLPELLGEAEVTGITREVITELNATSKADKGRVMGAVMQKVRGRADGKMVNEIVDRLLGSA